MANLKRRTFITLLGGTAAAWPLAARTQQPTLPVIGILAMAAPEANAIRLRAISEGLRTLGYIEGQNVKIEYRWAEVHTGRLPALAAELVSRQVAVIVASGTPAELKARVGRLSATVSLASHSDASVATRALEGAGLIPVHDEARGALVTSVDASRELASVVRELDGAGVEAAGLALAEPTLEDVYLVLARPDPSTAA